MATIINNPGGGEPSGSSGMGIVFGALIVLVLGVLFFLYGLPMLRGGAPAPEDKADINVEVGIPGGGDSSGGSSEGGQQ